MGTWWLEKRECDIILLSHSNAISLGHILLLHNGRHFHASSVLDYLVTASVHTMRLSPHVWNKCRFVPLCISISLFKYYCQICTLLNNILTNFVDVISVSYTHLDVYKRQLFTCLYMLNFFTSLWCLNT